MSFQIEIRPICEAAGQTDREAESAAWRAIVRERLGEDIEVVYNENGAPVLSLGRAVVGNSNGEGCVCGCGVEKSLNPLGYISVSHTRGWVAVVWSMEPCAVDIELKSRRISPAVAARMGLSEPTLEAWCEWEARYKYASLVGSTDGIPPVRFEAHPELVVAVIA